MKNTIQFPAKSNDQKRVFHNQLTNRDKEILILLGEYGCVSADRIKAHFWNSSVNSKAHYRRLNILKRMNLVENAFDDRSIKFGYRLTKKGARVLSDLALGIKVPIMRRSYKTQFEHDQLLIDTRRIIKASNIVSEFKTEAEVRQELLSGQGKSFNWENTPQIPDATFVINVSGKKTKVAIELELSPKLKRRYTRIFRNHLLTKNWGMVIYIVKNQELKNKLMHTLNDIKSNDVQVRVARKINGIYFLSLDELLAKKLAAPMTNGKREISIEKLSQLQTQQGVTGM